MTIRKILAVLPHGAVYGGVKRYIESGNALIKMGIDYAIATYHPAEWDWCPFSGRSFTIDTRADEEWDVVILTNPTLVEHMPKFRTRLKVMNVINGSYARDSYRKAKDLCKPDLVIGCSSSVARAIPICDAIIPGGIDPTIFHPKADFVPHRPVRLLGYGRQRNPRKRVQDLLKIFEMVRNRSSTPVELHLFDSKSRISGEGITFHFGLFGMNLAQLYRSCDIFISPEEQAGWHNTAAEAMACGLPVLCTADGTTDFGIDGETALVSPVGDTTSFVANVVRLIENHELRIRIASNGMKKMMDFTWEKYATVLLGLFEEAVARRWAANA